MKTNLHLEFVLLLSLITGIETANAQIASALPSGYGKSVPGYDLLSELTGDITASKIFEEKAVSDLEIKVSSFHVDLKSEKTIEFSARSAWAKDFVWKFGDGSTISGYQNVMHRFEKPGKYEVMLIASNDRETVRESVVVEVIDGSAPLELEEMQHYIVFPCNNKLEATIKLNLPRRERHLQLEIQDIQGNQVFQYEIGKVRKHQQIHVDLRNLESGKYYTVLKGKRYSLLSKLTVVQ